MTQDLSKAAIVVVTYKRQELLANLFDSILQLTQAPWRIVVVDNENSAETRIMVEQFSARATGRWGKTIIDADGKQERVVYVPQQRNGGGAGGFSAGVKKAYELGANWFWVMDDDVAVEPKGLELLAKWTDRYQVIQGARLDYDGGPFYWQYRFITSLGIPDPVAPSAFGPSGRKAMNTMCFEGAFFSRKVVEEIGLPDPRFFIYWDDTMYGYLASKVTQPVAVSDVVMRRTRPIANWDMGGLRQLNSTSDMNRYHIMRNRGYMARYFMAHGDYRPAMFALGTAATAVKELIRLVAVDRKSLFSGVPQLVRGWLDSRKLLHDPDWKPMPPLK
ncbi:glycosyltransferase [Bifidobacterium actinocoloniiforme DSM 22766]|uniref:Glycosyltransferase n=1 Tax=Bifidobacterium actinocoloniiforme DSM 22766 TaxID=1437605 RepID=A0A086Z150_9BIFI|nr:glycosyltransferase [Bifidobacterium actinocoloniiforme]AKV55420.1 glycosyl transferase [Bifidobacterium actinocoloniiforme DSM 22766]KFI40250.1 glycosyltransferase [Bifidobacterium actinocoloniiforme DSM 22766]